MSIWLNDEEERAWRDLLEMTARLNAHLSRDLQETAGLSHVDYGILVALTDAPDRQRRVFELQQALRWEQSRLSHQLTRMERRGLVHRSNCSRDRRGANVRITSTGLAAVEAAAPRHAATVRHLVFDDLTAEQLVCLQTVLKQILARLGEDSDS